MRIESFVPSRHGFSFRSGPLAEGEPFGLATAVDPMFGLSAGMAWVALDRYLARRPIPDHPEAPARGTTLHAELVQRQWDALARAGWAALRDWQALPERGVSLRAGSAERSRAEWRRLRRRLDAGVPVLLYLVLANGRHADPSTNRAVLAYGYDIDRRTRRVSLRVYDPARPGNDGVRLAFGLSRVRPLDARLAVQTPVRGFFCVPYDRPLPAAVSVSDAGMLGERGIASVLAVQATGRADGTLELLARGRRGELLRVRRRRSGRWAVEGVDALNAGDATVEDAVVLGRNSMVVRTSAGELLECRRRPPLGWRARKVESGKRRAAHAPALLRDASGVALYACVDGRLMQYRRGRLGAWTAEHIKVGVLGRTSCEGTPAVMRVRRSQVHVLTRTTSGELMHARWRGKAGWAAENVTARAGDRERFLVCDDPILLEDRRAGRLNVVARAQSGAVLLFRWTARLGWRAQDLSQATGSRTYTAESALSAAIDDDGTVHVVARTAERGVVHVWCSRDGAVGAQELTRTRPTIADAGHIDGVPAIVAAPAGMLHVFARCGNDLVLYRWAHGADWSVENVSRERAGPWLATDPTTTLAQSAMHLATADESGRVHHVCATPQQGTGVASDWMRVPGWVVDAASLPFTAAALLGHALSAPARALARSRSATADVTTPARTASRDIAETVADVSASPIAEERPVDQAFVPADATAAQSAERVIDADVPTPVSVDAPIDSQVSAADLDALIEMELAAVADAVSETDDADVARASTGREVDVAMTDALTEAGDADARTDASMKMEVVDAEMDAPIETGDAVADVRSTTEGREVAFERAAEIPDVSDLIGPADTLLAVEDALSASAVDADAAGPESRETAAGAPLDTPAAAANTPAAAPPAFDVDEWIMQEIDESPAPVNADATTDAPPLTPASAPVPALDTDDWSMPPAAADDSWNVPPLEQHTRDDASAGVAEIGPELEPVSAGAAPGDDDDWNLPPVEAVLNMDEPAHNAYEPAHSRDEPAHNTEAPSADATSSEEAASADLELTLSPVEPLPLLDAASGNGADTMPAIAASADDDWSIPASEPTPASSDDDWSLSASEPASASSDDDWSLSAPEPTPAGNADDWSLPAPEPTPASTDEDWTLPPIESPAADLDEEEKEPAPRRWQNPALAGLPLLDDTEPVKPAPKKPAPAPKPPVKKPASRKKTTADELERVMALADENRPELLDPD